MSSTYLLDTSVYSQPIKDHPDQTVLRRWERAGDAAVCTSAICLAELLQGLEMRQSEKYWRRYQSLLADQYPILPFAPSTAILYAQLAAELKSLGRTKPTVDLLIAATAKEQGLIVATMNVRHFADIPGLAVEHWGAP